MASLFNITILFPFTITTSEEVPYFRLYTIRLAIFGTFAFYGIKHLLRGSSTVYPIHFLKTFLFFLSVMGVSVGLVNPEWVSVKDWGLVVFFFWVAITLHLASCHGTGGISKINTYRDRWPANWSLLFTN